MTEKVQDHSEQQVLNLHYIKSNYFRVIKADGAWGALSPRGDLVISLFNERLPMPDTQKFTLSEGGNLLPIGQTTEHEGIIRELEVAISLRPEVAFSIANWLLGKVKEFEEQTGLKFKTNERGEVDIEEPKDGGDDDGNDSS
ncbi:MAG TPA: hypothetical protein VMM38_09020 [Aridibacter sp.]|nr:hypothetical protein [Aridibacter sp.]